MKYKVGDEVVLNGHAVVLGRINAVEIIGKEGEGEYEAYITDASNQRMVFNDNHIDHEKTAELNGLGELEKIVAEKNNRERVDAIEPAHYRQGNIDRIEVWYQTYPFDGFRWAMKSHIDKYIHRYESKGGIEDLNKATYFIKRLKEKELDL